MDGSYAIRRLVVLISVILQTTCRKGHINQMSPVSYAQ
jgi:hypothetical protein